jgi:two-component system KDP operon response regulator KdpE
MDDRSRILVVDDEAAIRRTLEINLSARGYLVDAVETGEEGLAAAALHHPDLAIVDLGLPGISGVRVITELRGWSRMPILVLSARDLEHEKVAALDAGADDYITKPFGMDELLARVRASLRRSGPAAGAEPVLTTADFSIDFVAKQVIRDGAVIKLTPTEWHMVEVLVRHENELVTRRQLLQEVWGPAYDRETHYLRVYMAQIRRKIEPDSSSPRYFLTAPGLGYRFVRSG